MDKGFLLSLVVNGVGASFLIYILNKVSNREKWELMWKNMGIKLSSFGRGKFGKEFWEKLEDFLEDRIMLALNGLVRGWSSDNNANKKENEIK